MRHTIPDHHVGDTEQAPRDIEAELGGREARLVLERKLLRKLDMRMSILVLIYILNYVRLPITVRFGEVLISVHRSTGIMHRETCSVLFPTTVDELLQRGSSERFRGGLASGRATIQHAPKHPLCWIHLDADTFVRTRNGLAVLFLMTSQEYVLELYPKALYISPSLHDALGCYILYYRLAADVPLPLLAHVLAGTTNSFKGALLTRFFLGFVEAAFFPGALFLLSKWYKRSELGLRTALLSCGILISNAFGSLMASGILSGMQGKLGYASWRSVASMRGSSSLTPVFSQMAIFYRGRSDNPGRCYCCIRTS